MHHPRGPAADRPGGTIGWRSVVPSDSVRLKALRHPHKDTTKPMTSKPKNSRPKIFLKPLDLPNTIIPYDTSLVLPAPGDKCRGADYGVQYDLITCASTCITLPNIANTDKPSQTIDSDNQHNANRTQYTDDKHGGTRRPALAGWAVVRRRASTRGGRYHPPINVTPTTNHLQPTPPTVTQYPAGTLCLKGPDSRK